MKTLILILLLSAQFVFGQDETKETKKTVSKTEGDTTISQSVIISKTTDITPRSDMIVINPVKFILFYNISYLHKFSEHTVAGIGIQTPTLSGIDGFGINAEVRLYPNGQNMRGFYFAPNISYNHLTAGNSSTDPFSLGALLGWQWFPGEQFALGLGIGVDHYWGSVSDNGNDFGKYNGFVPAIRFDIGYAW